MFFVKARTEKYVWPGRWNSAWDGKVYRKNNTYMTSIRGHCGWRWISVLTIEGWTEYISLGAGNTLDGWCCGAGDVYLMRYAQTYVYTVCLLKQCNSLPKECNISPA